MNDRELESLYACTTLAEVPKGVSVLRYLSAKLEKVRAQNKAKEAKAKLQGIKPLGTPAEIKARFQAMPPGVERSKLYQAHSDILSPL